MVKQDRKHLNLYAVDLSIPFGVLFFIHKQQKKESTKERKKDYDFEDFGQQTG